MRRAQLAALLMVTAACGATRSAARSSASPFGNRDLITYEEIKANKTPGWSAYDLIAQMRPHFLRSRGATSFRDPTPVRAVVYLDGVFYGKLDALKTLNIEEIREIQFINAGDATTRFGTDHLGGAILISTR